MTGDEQAAKVDREYLFDKNTFQKKEQDMDNGMKITAGLGSIDEYERFVQAGADEFFCGYVPFSWAEKYGTVMPLNRREVLCCNVQLGAYSELEILSQMVKKYKKPVHLTFNSLYYLPKQYLEIGDIIEKCMEIGFRSYIIADPALSSEEIDLSSEKHVPGYAVCYCISERGGETGRDPAGGGNGVRGLCAE